MLGGPAMFPVEYLLDLTIEVLADRRKKEALSLYRVAMINPSEGLVFSLNSHDLPPAKKAL